MATKKEIKKLDINPSVGSIMTVEKRTFIILKILKNKLRVREVFMKPTKGNLSSMSVGDFFEVPNTSSI